jgi:monofunctional biosynthetic peptidoglycan transglycosylase
MPERRMMDARMSSKAGGPRKKPHRGFRWLSFIIGIVLVMPVVLILAFRFLPVPATPQMAIGILSGEGVHYQWMGYDALAPALGPAVIAAEDQRFCQHHGFDWTAIDKAVKEHEHGRRLRGASTISQQAARSLFLVPTRSWLRKGAEAYLTVLMEALWPKKRILTAYLNLVDWGHGNYGAEAASRAYFHKSAANLTPAQAARLAAILPNPDDWSAARPGPYVARRSVVLKKRLAVVRRDGLTVCLRH